MVTDFDAIAKAAQESGSQEAMNALWREVFALDRWYFVGRGEMPNVQPFIGMMNEKPFLMAFTDSERAHAFAVAQKLISENGAVATLSNPVASAVVMAENLRKHNVHGVLFNPGAQGFFAPLPNVVPMFEFHRDELPAALWDAFIRSVRDVNHPQAWHRLLRRLGSLEHWRFLVTSNKQIATAVVDEKPHVLIYTDEPHVEAGLKQFPKDQASQVKIVRDTPARAVQALKQLFKPSGVNEIIINMGSEPLTCEVDDLERAVVAAQSQK